MELVTNKQKNTYMKRVILILMSIMCSCSLSAERGLNVNSHNDTIVFIGDYVSSAPYNKINGLFISDENGSDNMIANESKGSTGVVSKLDGDLVICEYKIIHIIHGECSDSLISFITDGFFDKPSFYGHDPMLIFLSKKDGRLRSFDTKDVCCDPIAGYVIDYSRTDTILSGLANNPVFDNIDRKTMEFIWRQYECDTEFPEIHHPLKTVKDYIESKK